jgi:hypothetical protein
MPSLTDTQLATLKAAILASPDNAITSLAAIRDDTTLTIELNSKYNPTTKAWITSQPSSESDDAPDYTVFDGLTAGKRDSWALFLAYPRDFTRSKVRKWVTDIWGAATAASSSEAILQTATRNITKFEFMFGVTASTTGTVTGGKLTLEGPVTMQDVGAALNLP